MGGKLITFEGIDGSGKTMQIKLLEAWLGEQGISALCTREPGGTPIGTTLRDLIFQQEQIGNLTELYLFLADRAEHFDKVVIPALKSGRIVLCDRCIDSTLVYQMGCNLHFYHIYDLCRWAMRHRMPDLTILLDLPAIVAAGRQQQTRFDRLPLDRQEILRQRYRGRIEDEDGERICLIDATQSIEQVQECIHRIVKGLLAKE